MVALGLAGILLALALLVAFAYRGWSVLILAPAAAVICALFSREPALAHFTQTFMAAGAAFLAQFFPLFLLGALFGKIMEDSGAISSIAQAMTNLLGTRRAILAVVLAGAVVTYGGVSLFVAFFVLAPMAQSLFQAAGIPRRLMPAAIVLGTSTFTLSALPGTPSIPNAIPMPFFGTTPVAAPGLGLIASLVMMGFGMWWLLRQQGKAQAAGEAFGEGAPPSSERLAADQTLRERAAASREFDPAEIRHGRAAAAPPPLLHAALPLVVVVVVNFTMSLLILPSLDLGFLAEPRWGGTTPSAVSGVWAVVTALACAIVVAVALNRRQLPDVRATVDAGVNASVLPVMSVVSLVGFGAVVAALPAFAVVRDAVLGLGGGLLVSLALSTNILAALTGSASGGLTIALDALGPTFMARALEQGIDPALLHRVAVIGASTLDSLPHNGAVVTLLAVCGVTHRDGYRDIVVVSILGALLALAIVIALGRTFGSF